jgi:glycosyltransferase involved in cell wall biosynthesis
VKRFSWLIRATRAALKLKPSVVSVHSVLLLPVGLIVKLATGASLIYDAHELETESASLSGKPILKFVAKIVERAAMPFVDHTIVVNHPIADWYRAHYKRAKVTAIHNYPSTNALNVQGALDLRRAHNIPTDHVIFIYQGLLSFGRGIDQLMDVFANHKPAKAALVLMGYGELEDQVIAAAHENDNIFFQPAVPYRDIVSVTRTADVGLIIGEPICLSYTLSLPNKLFEYIQAGLPIIAAKECTAMSQIIAERALGTVCRGVAADIAAAVSDMVAADRAAFQPALKEAAQTFVWENELPALLSIYRYMAPSEPPTALKSRPDFTAHR